MAKTIAVIGVGWVGGALARCLEDAGHEVLRHDPPKGMDASADLPRAEYCFICVPTPYQPEAGGFNLAHVEQAIAGIPGGKTVVIKSTVLPGTTDDLQRRFPQHRFVFNPEFLRQATADADMRHPDRQIIGTTPASAGEAEALMAVLPAAPLQRIVPATEAETIKYFGNCFLAIKVVFANQVFDVCEKLGIDYDLVKECAAADPRIGPSHLNVRTDGYRGYGGTCFPKDMRAFIQLGERLGLDLSLMKKAEELNSAYIAGNDRH